MKFTEGFVAIAALTILLFITWLVEKYKDDYWDED